MIKPRIGRDGIGWRSRVSPVLHGWLPGASAALALVLYAGASAVPAIAQTPDQKESKSEELNTKKVTLNLENADVRYALKLLFQSVGASYTLDMAVQGTVTADLHDVSFRTALESLLRGTESQLPLTYRVENSVFIVAPRRAPEPEAPTDPTGPLDDPSKKKTRTFRIQLNFADPSDITAALGGTMLPSRLANLSGMGIGGLGGGLGGRGNGAGGNGNGLGGNSGIGILGSSGNSGGIFGNSGGQSGGTSGLIGNFGSGFGNGNNGGNHR